MVLPRSALTLLASVCALAAPAAAEAAFPGANGAIAFDRGGSLLSTTPTGAETKLSPPATDFAPAVSPDGTQIAFAAGRDLFVMNADGSARKRLTTDGYSNSDPSWSPDGKRLVFSSEVDGNPELYVKLVAGGAATRITTTTGNAEHNPVWSPDGKRIAYERSGCDGAAGSCVYVVAATGGTPTNLTPEDQIPGCETQPGYHFNGASREPNWSPDGRQIVFAGPLLCDVSSLGSDIWVMNADGSGKTDLTHDDATGDRQPVFSPDGKQIAFMSDRSGAGVSIFRMAADGSGVTQVTKGTNDRRPDWGVVAVPCVVPKLAGKTKAKAAKALEAKGCHLGAVTRKQTAKGPKGVVVSQGKRAGAKVPNGTAVSVVLSK
jgi:Tol biopolymer transport system component